MKKASVKHPLIKSNALYLRGTERTKDVFDSIIISDEIKELLWVKQSFKNAKPITRFDISLFNIDKELSLIDLDCEVVENSDRSELEYMNNYLYNAYQDMSPEARYQYLVFLTDPFNKNNPIELLFIFHYGLERFLLTKKFEKTINLLLKLRETYKDTKYIKYSANPIILISYYLKRPDLIIKLFNENKRLNIDNYSINPSLFFLCKYSFDMDITSDDIMHYHTKFNFKKNTYINTYDVIFQKELINTLKELFGKETVSIKEIITFKDFNNLPKNNHLYPYFINVSLDNLTKFDESFCLPDIMKSDKFVSKMNDVLNFAHERVKNILKDARKEGIEIQKKEKKKIIVRTTTHFNSDSESRLLETLNNCKKSKDIIRTHFALQDLGEFYYLYRNDIPELLDEAIKYYKKDINVLDKYKKENGTPFVAEISSFKKLIIIYESKGEYKKARKLCQYCIDYFKSIKNASDFTEYYIRKLEKINKKSLKIFSFNT